MIGADLIRAEATVTTPVLIVAEKAVVEKINKRSAESILKK